MSEWSRASRSAAATCARNCGGPSPAHQVIADMAGEELEDRIAILAGERIRQPVHGLAR